MIAESYLWNNLRLRPWIFSSGGFGSSLANGSHPLVSLLVLLLLLSVFLSQDPEFFVLSLLCMCFVRYGRAILSCATYAAQPPMHNAESCRSR